MKYCYITFRSITFAQQGERVLHSGGIPAGLLRTPASLRERGCSYCLRLRRDLAEQALALLNAAGVPYSRIFEMGPAGQAEVRP